MRCGDDGGDSDGDGARDRWRQAEGGAAVRRMSWRGPGAQCGATIPSIAGAGGAFYYWPEPSLKREIFVACARSTTRGLGAVAAYGMGQSTWLEQGQTAVGGLR